MCIPRFSGKKIFQKLMHGLKIWPNWYTKIFQCILCFNNRFTQLNIFQEIWIVIEHLEFSLTLIKSKINMFMLPIKNLKIFLNSKGCSPSIKDVIHLHNNSEYAATTGSIGFFKQRLGVDWSLRKWKINWDATDHPTATSGRVLLCQEI